MGWFKTKSRREAERREALRREREERRSGSLTQRQDDTHINYAYPTTWNGGYDSGSPSCDSGSSSSSDGGGGGGGCD